MTTTPPGPRLPGTSLYDALLPRIQAINEEGGNMVSHLMSRPVLDMVDAGADTDPDLSRIRAKIHEAITAHQHKRDHKRFSAIFNAYSEALVYFSLRARGLDVHVLPEGDDKTPDFLTQTKPVVGFELKTIDVHSPGETYDAAMDRGFESGYEALERARAAAKSHERGVGVGTSSSSYAPHGEKAGPKEVLIQTIRKIRGNIKAGQYKEHPTILVVSLVRLGVREDGVELRRWQEEDEDFGGRANGHLCGRANCSLFMSPIGRHFPTSLNGGETKVALRLNGWHRSRRLRTRVGPPLRAPTIAAPQREKVLLV